MADSKGLGFAKKTEKSERKANRRSKSQGREASTGGATEHGLEQRAIQLVHQGRTLEAEAVYRQLIDADGDNPTLYSHLAALCSLKGRHGEAIDLLNKALLVKPRYPEALCHLGVSFHEQGDLASAISSYIKALSIRPNYSDAHYHLGNSYKKQGKLTAAIASYEKAVSFRTSYPEALLQLGIALREGGRPAEAIHSLNKALSLQPGHPEALNNLVFALRQLGDLDRAVAVYRQVLSTKQNSAEAHLVYASLLQEQGDLHGAIASCHNALALEPSNPNAYWILSQACLQIGNYSEGWDGYEWRWQTGQVQSDDCPREGANWHPAVQANRLLLWPEQGLGDQILFSSMLEDARTLAPHLLVKADARLLPLLHRSFPGIDFLPIGQAPERVLYDAHLPLGSLGTYLRRSLKDFSQEQSNFLVADKERSLRLRRRLVGAGELLCGISWRSKNLELGPDKSMSLEMLATALGDHPIRLVSLQYGDVQAEIAELQANTGIEVLQEPSVDNFHDLDGLASLIEACDLVITTSSTTAHLAGALGAPTFVLLGMVPLWYWGMDKETTPWYPALRLFRQPERGNWAAVMEQMKEALQTFIACWKEQHEEGDPQGTIRASEPTATVETHGVQESRAADLLRQGRTAEAEAIYRELVETGSLNAVVYSNLAALCALSGRKEEVIDLLNTALSLKPHFPDAHCQLGVALKGEGDLIGAIASYRKALNIRPDFADAHACLGVVQQMQGELPDAIASYKQALFFRPDDPETLTNLGTALHAQGDLVGAIDAFHKALTLQPEYAEAHGSLGMALREYGDLQGAVWHHQKAFSIQPDNSWIVYNLGNAQKELGDYEAAITSYNNALFLEPSNAKALTNLGNIQKEMGDLTAAVHSFQRAICLQPDLPEAYLSLSLALLLSGNYEEGWARYEWRLKAGTQIQAGLPTRKNPTWKPSLQASRLLIWSEQGVGDQILFCSMLGAARTLAPALLVQADPRLLPLLRRSMPGIDFYPSTTTLDDDLYDAQLAMGSLGRYLRRSLKDFQQEQPNFLVADKERSLRLRSRLLGDGAILCGISWKSKNMLQPLKSMTLEMLATALGKHPIRLVSLQYGDVQGEIADLQTRTGIQVLQEPSVNNFDDLDGLASLIEACDLVVTTSNTTVHLAGALGAPTYALLSMDPIWLWGTDTETTPWYPSLRCFRQPDPGNWEAVILQMKQELESFVATAAPNHSRTRSTRRSGATQVSA